jgi:Lar family restriction alleviation protein
MNHPTPAIKATADLLPCPFCGSEPVLFTPDEEQYQTVACECGVEYSGPTDEDCIESWNRRATPAAIKAAVPILSDERIEALFHALDGKKLIIGENQLNWNAVVRRAFARAIEADLRAALVAVAGKEGEQQAPWQEKIIGMEVSLDVSTGDSDALHRIYGTVNEVMIAERLTW